MDTSRYFLVIDDYLHLQQALEKGLREAGYAVDAKRDLLKTYPTCSRVSGGATRYARKSVRTATSA